MKQLDFATYDEYVEAQRAVTLRKLAKPTHRTFTSIETVRAIRQYCLIHDGFTGICHGVQTGGELDLFHNVFGGAWYGTDIVAEVCDGVRIFQHDFETVRNEWIGEFDVIYSNALDHARNPWRAVKAWMACLSPIGRLFCEWTPWHNKLSRHGWQSDCFAATDDEYYELLNKAGTVERVIKVQDHPRFVRSIFMVR